MGRKFKIFFILTLCLVYMSCQSADFADKTKKSANNDEEKFVESAIMIRSGTLEDDDIEEPMEHEQYKGVLEISNKICDQVLKDDYDYIYNKFFADELVKAVTLEKFKKIKAQIIQNFGEAKTYKKMQWFFIPSNIGRYLIESIKIVHHEKAVVYYIFTFDKNDLTKLIGFHMKVKKLKESHETTAKVL